MVDLVSRIATGNRRLSTENCKLITNSNQLLVTDSRAGVAPAGNFFQPLGTTLPKQAHTVPGVLELVNIGPYFSLPWLLMDRGFSATGAPSVQPLGRLGDGALGSKFDKDAAHLFNVLVLADEMFVAKQVIEAQFPGLALGLSAGVERAIFGAQLLGGIAGHPKSFFVGHSICPRRIR